MAEPMEIARKQRGRPRKQKDTIKSWQFARVAMILCAYDEARRKGDKHSVAVKDAVDIIRQRSPELSISESGVKRTLATWRPREGRTVLFFERSDKDPGGSGETSLAQGTVGHAGEETGPEVGSATKR